MAQRQAQISYKLEVDATSFEPQPKVESAIVQIHPLIRNRNSRVDACLEKIVRLAFSTRRKTIANSLKSFVPVEVIKCANIDPKCRAETLAITDYERLTGKMLDASLDKNCL
jgi:16S rRNA (adenine1518-N6/adenine1519-N6)-dimethyltransferase